MVCERARPPTSAGVVQRSPREGPLMAPSPRQGWIARGEASLQAPPLP